MHFLVDTRAFQKVENTFDALKAVQITRPHPNTGWMIAAGPMSGALLFFSDMVGALTRVRYRHFDTLPEALTFLKQQDQSLCSP